MKKLYTLLSILLAIILAAGLLGYIFFRPNTQMVSFNDSGATYLVIGDELIKEDNPAIVEDENIYLSYPVVKQFIDSKFYWDESNEIAIFTSYDKVIRIKVDEVTAMVNGRPVEIDAPLRVYGGIPYIPIKLFAEYYGVSLNYNKETDVVTLDFGTSYLKQAETINDKGHIRTKPTRKAPLLVKEIETGESMRVFEEYEKWYKVRTEKGIVGYIEKKFVKVMYDELENEKQNITENKDSSGEKINLVWEYFYSKNSKINNLSTIDGLDIVSPTWFSIVDDNGTIKDKVNTNYINWAHKNGYQVWGLVNNSFNPDITHSILNDSIKREKVIQELLEYYIRYNLDGINIDFENVYLKDKDLLTQFVRELTPMFREKGLTISMDVTIKSLSENWSLCYDRQALGEVVDYVAVMTYDQHWASSPEPGSVAQYTWVENGLKGILEEVPSEKVLLGLPFYTRLWKIENVNGEKKVTSQALSMGKAASILSENNATIIWDEESGQYYGEYVKGDTQYKIWLEDERSINLKSSLVLKYNLAGVASWRRGFEKEEIWQVLKENLKEMESYNQWASLNRHENISEIAWTAEK